MSGKRQSDSMREDQGAGVILICIGALFAISSLLMLFLHPDNKWPQPDKVVTLYTPETPDDRRIWSEAIRRFEAKYRHEGYRVHWITSPYGYYGRKIQFMEAARLQADVIYMDQKDFPLLTSLDILEDLDPLVGKELKISADDFSQVALRQMVFNGKLFALPILFSPVQVYYNKTLFRKHGIPLPATDARHSWTYAQFLAAARELTRDTDGDGRIDQYGLGGMHLAWVGFVWREGGRVFSPDLRRCVLDSPPAIRGLTLMDDLYRKYGVVAKHTGLDDAVLFTIGKLGMYFGTRFRIRRFGQIKDFEWGIAPMPRSDTTGLATTSIIVDSLALARHGQNKKVGIKLLEFLVSEEMMRFYAKEGTALPALARVARTAIASSKIPGDRLFLEVPPDSRYFYQSPEAAKEIHQAIWDKLPLIWRAGRRTPAQGAREAVDLVRLGFKRHRRRLQRFGRSHK